MSEDCEVKELNIDHEIEYLKKEKSLAEVRHIVRREIQQALGSHQVNAVPYGLSRELKGNSEYTQCDIDWRDEQLRDLRIRNLELQKEIVQLKAKRAKKK